MRKQSFNWSPAAITYMNLLALVSVSVGITTYQLVTMKSLDSWLGSVIVLICFMGVSTYTIGSALLLSFSISPDSTGISYDGFAFYVWPKNGVDIFRRINIRAKWTETIILRDKHKTLLIFLDNNLVSLHYGYYKMDDVVNEIRANATDLSRPADDINPLTFDDFYKSYRVSGTVGLLEALRNSGYTDRDQMAVIIETIIVCMSNFNHLGIVPNVDAGGKRAVIVSMVGLIIFIIATVISIQQVHSILFSGLR